MKSPKTVKGYLKMLIQICNEVAGDFKNTTPEEETFLNTIRSDIQNELGEDRFGIMEKYGLELYPTKNK